MNNLVNLSIKLLDAVIANDQQNINQATHSLKNVNLNSLNDDSEKISFWINIYNASFMLLHRKDIAKPKIYKVEAIYIDKKSLSLDVIEHQILRRGKMKYGVGYINNPVSFIKYGQLMPSRVDYRIHFTLNCGAISCPPISSYSNEDLNEKLDNASINFLRAETRVVENLNKIYTTRIFQWYLGDFGGMKGVREILFRFGIIEKDKLHYKIEFTRYNHEDSPDNIAKDYLKEHELTN
ncbi:DUF547 domain-containing protein [Marinigracilibium pacificum]|uniref:DUF547 domain-containing protein n=1 Tax=Marinigracilibium pacificum TaxID=2729599 RepID=A0A848J0Z5_9BACT|nr:DUF547 domain-containing protein [Marinigracilibium pacificum]NMM48220.1 DUF547 domain-containing protein [Marinigracilibium pacificum]